jgi:hypothetical protein
MNIINPHESVKDRFRDLTRSLGLWAVIVIGINFIGFFVGLVTQHAFAMGKQGVYVANLNENPMVFFIMMGMHAIVIVWFFIQILKKPS